MQVGVCSGRWRRPRLYDSDSVKEHLLLNVRFHHLCLLTGQRSAETDVGPSFANPRRDASSPSAHQPLFTAWATLSECLFHIKADVPETVTLINALKTSHPRPVASPFHKAQ